ncbi:MAG: phosphoserine phosphatase SerB [Microbacteriaceae bacterium]
MTQRPTSSARFLVILDADSTLIRDEAIELLAERAGSLDRVAEITAQAMNGELDFAASLRSRVATLIGLPVCALADVAQRIQLTDGVEELVAGVHRAGGRVGVASGGFHELLDDVAEAAGLDYCEANRLEVKHDALTGGLTGPVVDAAAKARSLLRWAADAGIPVSQTIAIGDGANDVQMMAEAALSVAFNAKPMVRSHAHVVMDRCDLSQVLPLLGLRG